jgi:hypothetical protein
MSEWGFVFLFLREIGPALAEPCPNENHESDACRISLSLQNCLHDMVYGTL